MSRRGRWSAVEEEYAHTLMEAFKEGILDVAEGTSLRSYLSMKLSCDPMRISKKFSGLTTTGRHYFKATEDTMEHRVKLKRLQVLEYQFAQQYHMCGMQSGWNRTPDMAVFQPFYPQQSYQVQYQQDYQNMSYMFPNIPSMSGYAARQNLTSKSCKMLSTDTNSTTGGSDSDVSKSSSIDGDNYSNSSKRVRCSDKANFPFSKTPQFVPFSNQGTCESLSESEEQESNAHEEPEASTSSRPPLHQNNSSQAINNNNLNMNSNLSGGRVVDTAYGPMLVFCEVNSSGVTVQRGVLCHSTVHRSRMLILLLNTTCKHMHTCSSKSNASSNNSSFNSNFNINSFNINSCYSYNNCNIKSNNILHIKIVRNHHV